MCAINNTFFSHIPRFENKIARSRSEHRGSTSRPASEITDRPNLYVEMAVNEDFCLPENCESGY